MLGSMVHMVDRYQLVPNRHSKLAELIGERAISLCREMAQLYKIQNREAGPDTLDNYKSYLYKLSCGFHLIKQALIALAFQPASLMIK